MWTAKMLQKGAFLERQETGAGRRDKALAFYILGGKVRMAGEVLEVALLSTSAASLSTTWWTIQ